VGSITTPGRKLKLKLLKLESNSQLTTHC
jgi:hypothetical protein